jgi:hypothetical protein
MSKAHMQESEAVKTVNSGARVQTKRPSEASIDYCTGCGNVISLLPPVPDHPVKTWLCNRCGSVYFGSDGDYASVFGVRQSTHNPFANELMVAAGSRTNPGAPSRIRQLVRSLGGKPYAGPDRRQDQRYSMAVPAVAIPLGKDFRVIGKPVQMTTLNVSQGGAALLHTQYTDTPNFALDFTASGIPLMQVILQVLRVRDVGSVYEIAGQFVSRMSQHN